MRRTPDPPGRDTAPIRRRRFLASPLLAAPAAALAGAVPPRRAFAARPYPSRPVRLVVPFPPGGGSDTLARFVAPHLSARWGQPVVIDNRGGAGGAIGTAAVAQAEPDGHTLLVTDSSAVTANPWLYERLPYRAGDLAAAVHLATYASALFSRPGLPAASLAELAALDRARPGSLDVATAGNGTSGHLALAVLNATTGMRLAHVPYRGAGPANTAFLAGEVELMMNGLGATTADFVASGRARALFVTSPGRVPTFPDVPTAAEAGAPRVEAVASQTLFAPSGTPRDVVERVNADVSDVLAAPDAVERWRTFSYLPFVRETPEQVAAWIAREADRWGGVVRALGIRLD